MTDQTPPPGNATAGRSARPDGVPSDGNSPQPDQIWTRKADVVWSTVDGEAVLLDIASGYYFSLNKVGAIVWDMLDGAQSLGSARDAICKRFQIDPATAWTDIAALIRHLSREKLAGIKQGG